MRAQLGAAGAGCCCHRFRAQIDARIGGKNALQRRLVDRLLQHRHLLETLLNGFRTVTGDKDQRDIAGGYGVGEVVDHFAFDIDVQNGGIEFLLPRRIHSVCDATKRPDHGKPELGESILHHHPNQRLVLDQQEAPAGKAARKCFHWPFVAPDRLVLAPLVAWTAPIGATMTKRSPCGCQLKST